MLAPDPQQERSSPNLIDSAKQRIRETWLGEDDVDTSFLGAGVVVVHPTGQRNDPARARSLILPEGAAQQHSSVPGSEISVTTTSG